MSERHKISWGSLSNANLTEADLSFCLCSFINEIRRKDGGEFPAKSLYEIVLLIQFHMEKKGVMWKLVDGEAFTRVRYTLDNVMKKRVETGNSDRKSADPISFQDEESLWAAGILGEERPVQLRETVLYLLGLGFALRGGEEHRRLRAPGFDSQLSFHKHAVSGKRYLFYQEDTKSKTNQGGIKGRKFAGQTAKIFESDNVDRCAVRLFEKYVGLLLRESKTNALYKKEICERHQSPKQWYIDKPIGINGLRNIIKNMCAKVGLTGRFMNHSLRVSAATRLYQCGHDEQMIKLFTGHKSDSVHYYKRPNETLLESASLTVMSGPCDDKKPQILKPEFDIDEYKLEAPVKLHVSEGRLPAHKRPCLRGDKCGGICEFLKAVDKKTREKGRQNKVKSVRLLVKFRD